MNEQKDWKCAEAKGVLYRGQHLIPISWESSLLLWNIIYDQTYQNGTSNLISVRRSGLIR